MTDNLEWITKNKAALIALLASAGMIVIQTLFTLGKIDTATFYLWRDFLLPLANGGTTLVAGQAVWNAGKAKEVASLAAEKATVAAVLSDPKVVAEAVTHATQKQIESNEKLVEAVTTAAMQADINNAPTDEMKNLNPSAYNEPFKGPYNV